MTVALVALGAAVGAPLRYLLDRLLATRLDAVLPWGTLTVNLVGSLGLGVLTGLAITDPVYAVLGTGFCGALSTYSTFGYETLRLAQEGARGYAALNVALNVVLGLAAAGCGLLLGALLA